MNDYTTQYDYTPQNSIELKKPEPWKFKRFLKKLKINKTDLGFIIGLLGIAAYLIATQPIFMSSIGCMSIVWLSIWRIIQVVPILEKSLGVKIRFWHIASVILSATALLNAVEPAQAIFLSGLESFLKVIAQQASAAGGGTAIDDTTIALIFNAIRGIFLLLVAAAALFAFNQAQQGNDWRPIATQIGLAFGIVIAIDVVTYLFVGNSAPTGS